MKKSLKAMRWAAMNAIMAIALWYGLVENVTGARNVGVTMVWFIFASSLATTSKAVRLALAKNKDFPSVPRYVDGSFDVAISLFIVWNGWIVTGVAYAFSSILHSVMYSAIEEIRATDAAPRNLFDVTE